MAKFKLSEKTKRRFRYGTNSVILMIVVIVVAVLVNVVLEQLPMTVDITAESLYSVTDTTKDLLEALDKDVEIYALYDQAEGESSSTVAPVMKYLDIYDKYDRVEVKYVDIDKEPSFLRETVGEDLADNFSAGDYLVKCGDNIRHIPADNMYSVETSEYYGTSYTSGIDAEACLTGAVMYVISDDIPVIYVSTGNGEASLDDYSKMSVKIQNNNFDVKEINLNQADIPEDCAAVMFLNPTADISTSVLNKLKTWFNDTNGNVICLMDYSQAGYELPNFNTLFQLFSLQLNNDVVSETSDYCMPGYPQILGASIVAADNSPNEGLSTDLGMYIYSRSINLLSTTNEYSDSAALVKTSAGATSTSIETGETSVGEKILAASGRYQGGLDVSKLYLTGSSLNLRDDYIEQFGTGMDGETLIRALNWMYDNTNEGDLIPAKEYNTNSIVVSETTSNVLAVVSIIVVPVIIMAVGFIIWLRRRHL